ncbi:MAG: hypothetical protein QF406_10445, partial [Verrucomicrobiota bacterium]|nr:hypothetical protein [Verrucomicrobiota bacterium]
KSTGSEKGLLFKVLKVEAIPSINNPSEPKTGSLDGNIQGKRIRFQLADGSASFWAEFYADGTHRHSERPEGKYKVRGLKVIVQDPEQAELVFLKPEITSGDTFEAKSTGSEKGLLFKVLKVEAIPSINNPDAKPGLPLPPLPETPANLKQ